MVLVYADDAGDDLVSRNRELKMREDPVISDRVHVSGGSTEGSLGRLAGAAAGGAQGMLAAGARLTFCVFRVVPVLS